MLDGKENWLSIILWRLGSVVKGDCPATDSTIIRTICRNDKVAESPTYTGRTLVDSQPGAASNYVVFQLDLGACGFESRQLPPLRDRPGL